MDKDTIKKYYVDEDESEVFAISLVEEPAIESDFVFLNSNKKNDYVALETNEHHMIYGAALRPDFPIYRYDGESEYYIEFSKKAIEKLCRRFFQNSFQNNWTKQHAEQAEGLTVVESWIKSDMQYDKSIALGLDKELPIGTWFVGAYCDSNDIWEQVKHNGTFKGFSVEAMVSLDELNFKKEEKMDNEKFWDKMKNILLEALTETQTTTTTTVEEPSNVEPTEQTVEEPIVNEEVVEQPTVEETVEEPIVETVEEPIVEEPKEEVVETVNEEPKEDVNVQIEGLTSLINELKKQIDELKSENEKLAVQPSATPTQTNATPKNTFREWREYVRNHS